jgi:hypothetical protein
MPTGALKGTIFVTKNIKNVYSNKNSSSTVNLGTPQ